MRALRSALRRGGPVLRGYGSDGADDPERSNAGAPATAATALGAPTAVGSSDAVSVVGRTPSRCDVQQHVRSRAGPSRRASGGPQQHERITSPIAAQYRYRLPPFTPAAAREASTAIASTTPARRRQRGRFLRGMGATLLDMDGLPQPTLASGGAAQLIPATSQESSPPRDPSNRRPFGPTDASVSRDCAATSTSLGIDARDATANSAVKARPSRLRPCRGARHRGGFHGSVTATSSASPGVAAPRKRRRAKQIRRKYWDSTWTVAHSRASSP